MPNNRKSFTLIELLVVLALVAILSVVVVMTLNPAELLKQARDSNRLSDLATINTALNLFSTDVTSGFMGTSTVVYVSIPDNASSTCGSLGLPTLPTGYTYNCVTSQNLKNTDGTGWIPVNFQRISSNSPISQLPIDPTNTTSTRLYYTYTPGGSWELNATVEASKNKLGGSNDLVSKDGGTSPSTYELGNNLNLSPIETGDPTLVGYWNFEEGPNATSTDRSGYGNHGTWYGTSTQQQHYTTGKVGSYAGYFNGGSDYINVGDRELLSFERTDQFTVCAWVYTTSPNGSVFTKDTQSTSRYSFAINGNINANISGTTGGGWFNSGNVPLNAWTLISYVYNGNSDLSGLSLYSNGIFRASGPSSALAGTMKNNISVNIGSRTNGSTPIFSGYIDDVRVYSRALSSAEISALYNTTK